MLRIGSPVNAAYHVRIQSFRLGCDTEVDVRWTRINVRRFGRINRIFAAGWFRTRRFRFAATITACNKQEGHDES